MEKVYLNGTHILTKEDAHSQLKQTMGFPEYYGKNLDALYDMLSTWSKSVEICISNPSDFFEHLGTYGQNFIKTIEEAGAQNWRISLKIEEESHEIC